MLIVDFAFLKYPTLISFLNETPMHSIGAVCVNNPNGAIAGLNCIK